MFYANHEVERHTTSFRSSRCEVARRQPDLQGRFSCVSATPMWAKQGRTSVICLSR